MLLKDFPWVKRFSCILYDPIFFIIKSGANILTRVQNKSYKEPHSFSSLFNLPYNKDILYDMKEPSLLLTLHSSEILFNW